MNLIRQIHHILDVPCGWLLIIESPCCGKSDRRDESPRTQGMYRHEAPMEGDSLKARFACPLKEMENRNTVGDVQLTKDEVRLT